MVQIRKPVERSENIIDRRRPGTARFFAQKRSADAKKLADEVLAEAIAEAMKLRHRRPR